MSIGLRYHIANLFIKTLGALLNGIALKLLWGWFGVALIDIGYWHSVGISMMARFLTTQQIPRDNKDLLHLLVYTIYNPLLAIGLGYGTHYLMVNPLPFSL